MVTVACQSPGVIVAVVAVAVVAAILKAIQQLFLVARGFAPSPFTLRKMLKRKMGKRKLTGTITPSESTSVAHHLLSVSSLNQNVMLETE